MRIRRGIIGGTVVALFASLSVGNAAESFWGPFLTTLAFSLLVVGVIVGLMILANRGRTSQ